MGSHFGRAGIAGCLVTACLLTVGTAGQSEPPTQQVPKVKNVPTPPIVSVGGEDNYIAYCAVCHGMKGKGDGPAAPAMKAPVPDLTTVAKRNNGKFNAASVKYIINGTGKTPTPAHGVEDMPIWGDVFRHEDLPRRTLRIDNLVKYLQSIQEAGPGGVQR